MQQLFPPLSREPFPPIVPRLEEEISFRDLALHRTGFHLGGEKKSGHVAIGGGGCVESEESDRSLPGNVQILIQKKKSELA